MQMYELEPLMANIHKKHKEGWEQARLIAYMVAQVNSSKKLKPTDILQFIWDEESKEDTVISREDIRRLQDKAAMYLQTHNK